MTRYFYAPLFSAPSAQKPGSTPTASSYSVGFIDPVTGVRTSASNTFTAALALVGVDIDAITLEATQGPPSNPLPGETGARGVDVGFGIIGGANMPRPARAKKVVLYVDTVRRIVVATPDAFTAGPFIALGWIERTSGQVEADYPGAT